MDIPKVTLPKIIPADKALKTIRKYNPTELVGIINMKLESFISNITDITTACKSLNITKYCAGYTADDIRLIVDKLIKEYTANGYIIDYYVVGWSVNCFGFHRPTKIVITIKSIRFDTSKITKPVTAIDDPPAYRESVKKKSWLL